MTKNFGTPPVSGYLDPTGRAWETVVTEAGKVVLDKELNLMQDIDGGAAQDVLKRDMPSGWLSDDFLTTSSATSAFFASLVVANTLQIPNGLKAHVNGWLLTLSNSYANGSNRLDLGVGPAGAGAQRTDLVILEVWRRLVGPTYTGDGSTSPTNRIWQNGNVATDPASDLTLNYPNDLLDTFVGSESTKRVQIQYRLRVVPGVDVFTYATGMADPMVFAHSSPTTPLLPNGTTTAFTFVNQSANGDPGLWVAGDGNPTNSLNTVDGFMYAMPLCAVFRRNTSAFNGRTNQNGGVASPGPSDRPDGLFMDIIDARDLYDLRTGVSPTGWSLPELLQKNVNYVLDNSLRTEIFDTSPLGGGNSGTTVLRADEIGVTPGDGVTTGDTGAGKFQGSFDGVRRRFSDRSVIETVTVVISPPAATWADNDSISVDPTALAIYPYATFNWSSHAPATVQFLDIQAAWWAGSTNAKKYADAIPHIVLMSGLGSEPIQPVSIQFDNIATNLGLTNEKLYVTMVVAYPTHSGLYRTPAESYGNASFTFTTSTPSAAAPISYASMFAREIDAPHREVHLEYQTSTLTFSFGSGASPTSTYNLPERAQALVGATVPVGGVLDPDGRNVTFGASPSANSLITISYTAVRPMPQVSGSEVQMRIFYRAAAPQMSRAQLLGTTLTVTPKVVGEKLYSLTVGSGSQDEGYPFPFAYVQTGGVLSPDVPYNGESELAGGGNISVAEFNAATGLLGLPVYVQMVANPESLTFNRVSMDIDLEDRSFFKSVPGGYVPNAYSQDLSSGDRHKNFLPILAELSSDGTLGKKGELVLVLLIRYAVFDETNGVFFDSNLATNATTASVFKVKGHLLNKRVS